MDTNRPASQSTQDQYVQLVYRRDQSIALTRQGKRLLLRKAANIWFKLSSIHLPRRLRRSAERAYATQAYRKLYGRAPQNGRYRRPLNPTVLAFVVDQARKLNESA